MWRFQGCAYGHGKGGVHDQLALIFAALTLKIGLKQIIIDGGLYMTDSTRAVFLTGFAVALLVAAGSLQAETPKIPVIFGEYVEARTCDVWTGPCFSNGELNTTGEFAIMGWKVANGIWHGQDLGGLKITAAIRARGTIGTESEGKVKSIIYIDNKATKEQGQALIAMVKKLAPNYFKNILDVRRTDISYTRDHDIATLEIKDIIKIQTTALKSHCDTICGNEEVAYPSLGKTDKFHCAKTVAHFFKDDGLKARWSYPFKRSAILGSFSL